MPIDTLTQRALEAFEEREAMAANRRQEQLVTFRERAQEAWRAALGEPSPPITDWRYTSETGTWLTCYFDGLTFVARPVENVDAVIAGGVRQWEVLLKRYSDQELLTVRSLVELGRLLSVNGLWKFRPEAEKA